MSIRPWWLWSQSVSWKKKYSNKDISWALLVCYFHICSMIATSASQKELHLFSLRFHLKYVSHVAFLRGLGNLITVCLFRITKLWQNGFAVMIQSLLMTKWCRFDAGHVATHMVTSGVWKRGHRCLKLSGKAQDRRHGWLSVQLFSLLLW